MTAVLQCTRCRTALDNSFLNRGGLSPCPSCGVPLEIEAFAALFRPVAQGVDGEPVMVDGESSCFFHPQKKASVPCHACGRFLCALCDCELNGEHFCPTCLETGKQKGKIKNLENQRTLYGNIALSLAIYPVVLLVGIYFMFLTAPLAIYVALRYWKAPVSIVGGGRARHVLAIIIGVVELVGWVGFVYMITTQIRQHG